MLRQNEVRQSFETFSNEFNLRLSQEMDSMMSMMHNQINRAITTAINERVIPEIQNIASSMSSAGHRDTEASLSPISQENREGASGPKMKFARKDSRSVGDLKDTTGHDSHIFIYLFIAKCPKIINSNFDADLTLKFVLKTSLILAMANMYDHVNSKLAIQHVIYGELKIDISNWL